MGMGMVAMKMTEKLVVRVRATDGRRLEQGFLSWKWCESSFEFRIFIGLRENHGSEADRIMCKTAGPTAGMVPGFIAPLPTKKKCLVNIVAWHPSDLHPSGLWG